MLHPMMPFITEEVYHSLRERSEEDCIIVAPWPQAGKFDVQAISDFETAKQIITEVRSVRAQKNLSPRETLGLIQKGEKGSYSSYELIISKLANVDLKFGESANGPAASFIIGTEEFAVPLEGMIDTSAEISKLEEELKYQQGFLNSVMKKLSNERFVSGAPEQVVAAEQKKRDDAESRITSIKEQLVALK